AGRYTQTFFNLTAATQGDVYLTFGLVDSISGLLLLFLMIIGVAYRDVNGKDGSPLFNCSLYTQCHGPETATNIGGQSQPNGSLNCIIKSDGWCRS
ncbi:fruit-body specific protein A, partial [Coprinopsis sp. MPI-PUGE-AT-0042]